MKFRILTNGEIFKIQREVKKSFGRTSWEDEERYYVLSDAVIYIRNTYGTSAVIIREWRPA